MQILPECASSDIYSVYIRLKLFCYTKKITDIEYLTSSQVSRKLNTMEDIQMIESHEAIGGDKK